MLLKAVWPPSANPPTACGYQHRMLCPNATYIIQERERGHAQAYDSSSTENGLASHTVHEEASGSDVALLHVGDASAP